MVILRYHPLRKKEVNKYKKLLANTFPKLYELVKDERVGYVVSEDEVRIICIGDLPALIELGEDLIPTLLIVKQAGIESLPYAVVDEGAVKHLINGADVMVPGITEVSTFNKDEIVSVWEPKRISPIVIGRALMDSETIKNSRKGRAIKNLHHAGDDAWDLTLKFLRSRK